VLGADRLARYQTGVVNYLPAVAREGEPCMMPTPDSYEWFMRTSEALAPTWRNEVSIESIEQLCPIPPDGTHRADLSDTGADDRRG
jgi:hypothetical protein